MIKTITALFFLLIVSTHASDYNWELQVTNPDYELNYDKLKDDGHKPYLKATSWRCYVEPIQHKNNLELRRLRCNYSIEKTGKVSTIVSCGQKKSYNETTLELFDERKNLTFSVMLLCRKK